jgi:alkylation response protein AidB-like acyl-CoA dehydrogenase
MAEHPLIERARALAPQVLRERDEMERSRRLTDGLVQAMVDADLFRAWVPANLGGSEADPRIAVRMIEEVARVDGSAGWNLCVGATWGILAGFLRTDVAAEIFGRDKRAILAGTLNPTGRATAVEGGYRVRGRWAFGSGIAQAGFVLGNCVIYDGDKPRPGPNGQPDMKIMICPKSQCTVHDTWFVGGLKGTGSHDYSIEDVFVPEARSLVAFTGKAVHPGRLYSYPFSLFVVPLASVSLGIARGAIDTLLDLASKKTPTGAKNVLRERASTQSAVGRAESMLRSARAFLFEALEAMDTALATRHEATMDERAHLRLACAHAALTSVEIVGMMFDIGGATSNYESSPLERFARDARAAYQHIGLSHINFEIAGRVLLGLNPETPRF